MEKKRDDAMLAAGCLSAVWVILVQVPMWLIFMFGLIQAVNPPQWVWVLFWCYVPVSIIGSFVTGILKVFTSAE